MSDSDLQRLTDRAESIHDQYRREFSGRSRATRDASVLDGMLAQLAQVAQQAEALAGNDADALLSTLTEREQLYRTERDAIRDIQADGPDAVRAARLNNWTWVALRRYQRNYAGQRRATRDLELLVELSALQRGWNEAFAALSVRRDGGAWAETTQQMASNLELFDSEAKAVREARASLDPAELSRVMATVANGQFNLYRRHFEGKSRRTRRIALLERVNRNLREVLRGMQGARDAGVQTEANLGNIDRVQRRIEMHQAEAEKIRLAQATVTPAELTGMLGDDANGLFRAYREGFGGVARKDADIDKLDDLCDQLFEIGLQMEELDRRHGLPTNARNIEIVLDNLKQFERERQRIAQAHKS